MLLGSQVPSADFRGVAESWETAFGFQTTAKTLSLDICCSHSARSYWTPTMFPFLSQKPGYNLKPLFHFFYLFKNYLSPQALGRTAGHQPGDSLPLQILQSCKSLRPPTLLTLIYYHATWVLHLYCFSDSSLSLHTLSPASDEAHHLLAGLLWLPPNGILGHWCYCLRSLWGPALAINLKPRSTLSVFCSNLSTSKVFMVQVRNKEKGFGGEGPVRIRKTTENKSEQCTSQLS